MILFRCDAGPKIGGGHLMRCLALARACAERGLPARFASESWSEADRTFVEAHGFGTVDLPSDQKQTEALAATAGSVLVLDRYLLPIDYVEPWLATGRPVLQLVDGGEPLPGVRVALDQNLGACLQPRAGRKDLLGLRYALLRPEFRDAAAANDGLDEPVPPRVLVTMGAADPAGLTAPVVSALRPLAEARQLDLDVVIGPHARGATIDEKPGLTVHRAPPNMAALMAGATIAVAASGSSLWELFAVGLPRIVVPVAPNQEPLAAAAGRIGAAVVLRSQQLRASTPLREAVEGLLADPARRRAQREAGLSLVDGAGARRVAQVIEGLLNEKKQEAM